MSRFQLPAFSVTPAPRSAPTAAPRLDQVGYRALPTPTPTPAPEPYANIIPQQLMSPNVNSETQEAPESMFHQVSEWSSRATSEAGSFYNTLAAASKSLGAPPASEPIQLLNWQKYQQGALETAETIENKVASPLDVLSIATANDPLKATVQAFVGGMGMEFGAAGGAALGTFAEPVGGTIVGGIAGGLGGYALGSSIAGAGYDYVHDSPTAIGDAVRTVSQATIDGRQYAMDGLNQFNQQMHGYESAFGNGVVNNYNALPGEVDQLNQGLHGYEQSFANGVSNTYDTAMNSADQLNQSLKGYEQSFANGVSNAADSVSDAVSNWWNSPTTEASPGSPVDFSGDSGSSSSDSDFADSE